MPNDKENKPGKEEEDLDKEFEDEEGEAETETLKKAAEIAFDEDDINKILPAITEKEKPKEVAKPKQFSKGGESSFRKRPSIVGEPYELILLKLLNESLELSSIARVLNEAGYKVSEDVVNYYAAYYEGRIQDRYSEVCRMHKTMLEHSIGNLKEKIGKNASSLQQLNYYIEVMNIEIEIVRNFTQGLSVNDREELLEKLVGRVQNLMTLKNKYVSDLDRKDNVKKIILDIIRIASETLLHESLSSDQKKEMLDKFKDGVKEYVGYVE